MQAPPIVRLALAFALLLAASAGRPTPAHAQSARDLFVQGTAAYRVGDYERAIQLWTQAYAADPQPLLQYNLGQAYERLGRLDEAVAATERYLNEARPDDPQRSEASARLASMRERLNRTGILVHSNVEGAAIVVDGEDMARTPRRDPVRVSPGSHTVVVQRAGYQEYRGVVQVTAGGVIEVDANLVAAAGGAAVEGEPAVAGPPSRFPAGGWALTGTGGAMAVTGAVLGLVALKHAKDAPASTGSQADSAKHLALASDVLLFGGLGVAVGGVLWLLLGQHDDEPPETQAGHWQVRPVLGATVVGADAQLRF